jgi:hypothetical protein
MSPTLFNIFIEELFEKIRGSEHGVMVRGERLYCLGFADDVMILSDTAEGLQNSLSKVTIHGRECSVKFSAAKCKVMKFGGNENESWILGDSILEVVKQYKYLGITIGCGKDIFEKHKREKELGMLRMYGMLRAMKGQVANVYRIIRELWKGVAVPRSLYGYEVCTVTKKETKRMETIQNKVARLALGANSYVATEALRGEMGWSRYENRIANMKINYYSKLKNGVTGSWAEVIGQSADRSRWRNEIKRYMRGYQIEENMLQQEDGKKVIRTKILQKSQTEWERVVGERSTLRIYKNKPAPGEEKFYDGSLSAALLFKARTGSLEVKARTYRWSGSGEICEWCTDGERETIEHLMIECRGHTQERETAIHGFITILGGVSVGEGWV